MYEADLDISINIREITNGIFNVGVCAHYKDRNKDAKEWEKNFAEDEKDAEDWKEVNYDVETFKEEQGKDNKLKDLCIFVDLQLERILCRMDSAVRYGV